MKNHGFLLIFNLLNNFSWSTNLTGILHQVKLSSFRGQPQLFSPKRWRKLRREALTVLNTLRAYETTNHCGEHGFDPSHSNKTIFPGVLLSSKITFIPIPFFVLSALYYMLSSSIKQYSKMTSTAIMQLFPKGYYCMKPWRLLCLIPQRVPYIDLPSVCNSS